MNNAVNLDNILDQLDNILAERLNSPSDKSYVSSCFEKGVSKINIITGKGSRSKNKENPYQSKDLSILKHSVPNFIRENKDLKNKIIKIDFESVENPSKGNFDIFLRKKID